MSDTPSHAATQPQQPVEGINAIRIGGAGPEVKSQVLIMSCFTAALDMFMMLNIPLHFSQGPGANMTGGAERLGEIITAMMLRLEHQPVLFLLDLPEAEEGLKIPKSMPSAQVAYEELLDGCKGLRCPRCGEDGRTCLASPLTAKRMPPSRAPSGS